MYGASFQFPESVPAGCHLVILPYGNTLAEKIPDSIAERMKTAVEDTWLFFNTHVNALPIFEALEEQIRAQIPDVKMKIQKSQITFANRRVFACVSFLPVRKAPHRPKTFLTVTFGLSYRKESPRIDAATEPYPNRWTHHVTVGSPEEIDEELLGWIREAAEFSAVK